MNILFDFVTVSASAGKIPWEMAEKGYKALKAVSSSIKTIERNSFLPYPDLVVVPMLKVLQHEAGLQGVVHANIDFKRDDQALVPVVSLSLPFLIFGKKIHYTAILAHEFLHYLYLSLKFLEMDIFSLEQRLGNTLMGKLIFDAVEQIQPKKVYKGSYLIKLVTTKFDRLIHDKRFLGKIERRWINQCMPSITLTPQNFGIVLSSSDLTNLYFPDEVLRRTGQLSKETLSLGKQG